MPTLESPSFVAPEVSFVFLDLVEVFAFFCQSSHVLPGDAATLSPCPLSMSYASNGKVGHLNVFLIVHENARNPSRYERMRVSLKLLDLASAFKGWNEISRRENVTRDGSVMPLAFLLTSCLAPL